MAVRVEDPRYPRPLVRSEDVSVGVVGLGYWGPNLARNFDVLPGCELAWCCDGEPWRANASNPCSAAPASPIGSRICSRIRRSTRWLSRRPCPPMPSWPPRCWALASTASSRSRSRSPPPTAERALEAQRSGGKVLMVGHLLEYHPGVRKLKEIVDSGELGRDPLHLSNRLNLGKLRADENALWSLGAHDVSVVLQLAGEEPFELAAHGESYMRPGIEDVVFCFMRFRSGLSAHMHLSWLDPHKERRFTVVGSKKMATFDDMEPERKLTIYDKGFDGRAGNWGEYVTRAGDIYSPAVANREPLRLECEHFIECVRSGATPVSDGESGLRVVRVLEGLQAGLERSRRPAADELVSLTAD